MKLASLCTECLAPAVFTINMGTGAFSIATLLMSRQFPCLLFLAWFLNIVNFALFAIFFVWALFSWSKNINTALSHFGRPDHCSLYAAVGLATLVLSAQSLSFGFGLTATFIIWLAGTILTLSFNYGILITFFLHPHVELEHITPVLFIPVASMVVIPVIGAPLASLIGEPVQNIILVASLLALGGGLALYTGLFGLMLQRHLVLAPLPDYLTPTLWIHLAPIGWAGVALLSLAEYILPPQLAPAASLFALLLWGAGFWWLIMAAVLCLRAVFRRTLAFSLSWWSFIFPIGSLTILSSRLDFPTAQSLFPVFWTLMACLWFMCASRSLFSLPNFWRKLAICAEKK